MLQDIKNENERILSGIRTLEERLHFRIAVLARLLDRQHARMLASHGLTLAKFRVLITLDAFGEMSSSELTKFTVVDPALISRNVAEMNKEGLIESRPDPKDGRRKFLKVTATGHQKLEALMPDSKRREAGLKEVLDPETHTVLIRALEVLTDHVSRDLGGIDVPA